MAFNILVENRVHYDFQIESDSMHEISFLKSDQVLLQAIATFLGFGTLFHSHSDHSMAFNSIISPDAWERSEKKGNGMKIGLNSFTPIRLFQINLLHTTSLCPKKPNLTPWLFHKTFFEILVFSFHGFPEKIKFTKSLSFSQLKW
jgi:hypothetical protein